MGKDVNELKAGQRARDAQCPELSVKRNSFEALRGFQIGSRQYPENARISDFPYYQYISKNLQ